MNENQPSQRNWQPHRILGVDLLAPDGTIHRNVVNIMRFAKAYNLGQSSLNAVAIDRKKSYKGWRRYVEGMDTTPLHTVQRSYVLLSPTGSRVIVTSLPDFAKKLGVDSQTVLRLCYRTSGRGLEDAGLGDGVGRAWHIEGTIPRYTFWDKWTGIPYAYIVDCGQFAKCHGVSRRSITQLKYGHTQKSHRFVLVKVDK